MYTNVYLKTSKIDSCTPKVVFNIYGKGLSKL